MNRAKASELVVVMPTQNRPSYLYRALEYYHEKSMPYIIHVVDSSEEKNKQIVKKIVENSKNDIIFHDHDYGVSVNQKIEETLSMIESKYFLMVADDDFVLPHTISRCVDFLNSNDDFSAAHGRSYKFSTQSKKKITITTYHQHSLEMADPITRFIAHMKDWSTTAYSVQKTKNIKEIISNFKHFKDDITSQELFWYATNVIRGKIAKLNMPYMYREADAPKEWKVNEFSCWVREAKYADKLITELARELHNASGYPVSDSSKLSRYLLNKWIIDHRPFECKNVFSYSMVYYKNKLTQRVMSNILPVRDAEVFNEIKRFLMLANDFIN